MAFTLSENEAACLEVAIDLLERSDAKAADEPQLSRQYARQAYELGQLSSRLRDSIVQQRVRMIVRDSGQGRISGILAPVPQSKSSRLRRTKKASFMVALFLVTMFSSSTPVDELPDQRVELAARFVDAPF